MKIEKMTIKNYASINEMHIDFDGHYTALCGQNNAGKSNILSAIETLLEHFRPRMRPYYRSNSINRHSVPNWSKNIEGPTLEMEITLYKEYDKGIFDNPNIPNDKDEVTIKIVRNNKDMEISVNNGSSLEGRDAKTLLRDFEDSIIKYDSSYEDIFGHRSIKISEETQSLINKEVDKIGKHLATDMKSHMQELEGLLGRLNEKYTLSISTPYSSHIGRSLPYEINLGDRKDSQMSLELWGSGTRNQTLILDAIFKAKIQKEDEKSNCPILIIEEPESFLHSSAQFKFSQLLQDVAEELKIQIIVATHNLHMLSYKNPKSNLLIARRIRYKKLQESYIMNTDGDNWVLPFNEILGVADAFDKKSKDLIFGGSNVLFVEGEADKEYIELLIQEKCIKSNFRIVSLDGKQNCINNPLILNVISKDNTKRAFMLDKDQQDEEYVKSIDSAGVKIIWVGTNDIKNIEGLVPREIREHVRNANSDIADKAIHGRPKERKVAISKIKEKILGEIKQRNDKSNLNKFRGIANEIDGYFSSAT